MDIQLIGICGRYGAGKTTLTNFLTQKDKDEYIMIDISNRMDYILHILFDFSKDMDSIWGLTYKEAYKTISNLLDTHIDSNLSYELSQNGLYKVPEIKCNENKGQWIELSFAKALKQITSIIFDYDYEILLGITEEARIKRDHLQTKQYNKCGKLTGRQCLEFLGTDVMRKYFDEDIWIKILKQNINKNLKLGNKIIISDVRFVNEKNMIIELKGKIVVIYKKDDDLILTEKDKCMHSAYWSFLEFIDDKTIYIKNDGSIKELEQKISEMFETMNN